MKKKLNKNLSKIRNFLALTKTENPTQEEVFNFLLECKTFVFNQYGVNENDYDIEIQFVHPKILDYDEAKMCADEDNTKKFVITLNKHKLSNKFCNLDEKPKNRETESKEVQHHHRITSILSITQSFFHELGHVFQYIKTPKMMQTEDELKDNLIETFEQVCCMMENNRKTRLIIKTLGKHINALAYMSRPEKDADKKAYLYFASMLSTLINAEEDEDMLEFLCSIYAWINKFKKNNHMLYRAFSKENREAIEKLEKLEFTKELEELTRSLVG